VIGHYVALREAVNGFKTLGDEEPKVFISTGNVVVDFPMPVALTLGPGTAGRMHMVDLAVRSYEKKNFRYVKATQPK